MILAPASPMRVRRLAGLLLAVLLALPLVHGCGERMTPEEAALPIEGVEPVESRDADWPVLPREGGADGYDDPFEDVNRVFFYMNGAFDFLFFEPLARFYRGMMPTDARNAISRAYTNLAEPVVAANHLLQLEGHRAGTSLGRFLVNSTAGAAGLFDVASEYRAGGRTTQISARRSTTTGSTQRPLPGAAHLRPDHGAGRRGLRHRRPARPAHLSFSTPTQLLGCSAWARGSCAAKR